MNVNVLSALAAIVGLLGAGFGDSMTAASAQTAPAARREPRDDRGAESLGWRLGVQAWTFRDRTAFEAIDTSARLGVKYMELYPGQPLSPAEPKAKVGPGLTAEQVRALKEHLRAAGVAAQSYGVIDIADDEAAARREFEFAREMGMVTVVAEPKPEARDLASRLADEYGLTLAIHNHPRPSLYWNPDIVLEAIRGRSSRMAACADTGHWPRSGLRSLDCLKKLEGHIAELHFKDIANGIDRVWGTGDSDAPAMLAELKRQGFRGQVYVEYESGQGAELESNVSQCIAFFDRQATALAGEAAPEPKGTGTPGSGR